MPPSRGGRATKTLIRSCSRRAGAQQRLRCRMRLRREHGTTCRDALFVFGFFRLRAINSCFVSFWPMWIIRGAYWPAGRLRGAWRPVSGIPFEAVQ